MEENKARRVVDALRERGTDATMARVGVYQFGISIRLSDGREATWDSDGTAALEAQVMRDGVLVGFVPAIEGSDDSKREAFRSAAAILKRRIELLVALPDARLDPLLAQKQLRQIGESR